MPPLEVALVYNKANTFGLAKDANLLASTLPVVARSLGLQMAKVRLMDPREPPVRVDICIHLEMPYGVWFPWARVNCMMVNQEWWEESWSSVCGQIDYFIYKSQVASDSAPAYVTANGAEKIVVPWLGVTSLPKAPPSDRKRDCVWFLGASISKRGFARSVLPLWSEVWPELTVYTTTDLGLEKPVAPNVRIVVKDLKAEERALLASQSLGHICFSEAEGFGFATAEAEACGAFMFLNTLPVYEEYYRDVSGVAWIQTNMNEKGRAVVDADRFENDMAFAIHRFLGADASSIWNARQTGLAERKPNFLRGLEEVLKSISQSLETKPQHPRHMPPILNSADCPPISVVTLIYNRPKFIENCFLNLLSTDYPRDKIEWIVVDDSDADQSPSQKIVQFQQKFAPGTVKYIPCFSKLTVGRKRNVGCNKASHDIILMMDDDDHYPTTSFRRRVAWLIKSMRRYECAVCTSIAMYDLVKGVSAVNVPPYAYGLSQRCSEATLTFTKSFWSKRHFTETNVAEGEEFLKGREAECVEMPPQQIIVALTHKENSTSRRIPGAEGGTGCFWGFPKELLVFLHGLAGVQVEEA